MAQWYNISLTSVKHGSQSPVTHINFVRVDRKRKHTGLCNILKFSIFMYCYYFNVTRIFNFLRKEKHIDKIFSSHVKKEKPGIV